MSSQMFKWCPRKCGKKVVYNPISYRTRLKHSNFKNYKCQKCNKRFNKKELGLE